MARKDGGSNLLQLVSLGATLFVIMGAYGFRGPDADPTRVAAQICSRGSASSVPG